MQHVRSTLVLSVWRAERWNEGWRCAIDRGGRTELGCFGDDGALAAFIDQHVGEFLGDIGIGGVPCEQPVAEAARVE